VYARDREAFMRTFLVPGLHHCSRGDGAPTDTPDKMLEAAQAWVEKGVAPESVQRSIPIHSVRSMSCPPLVARSMSVQQPRMVRRNHARSDGPFIRSVRGRKQELKRLVAAS
jgi:hypothetical protein